MLLTEVRLKDIARAYERGKLPESPYEIVDLNSESRAERRRVLKKLCAEESDFNASNTWLGNYFDSKPGTKARRIEMKRWILANCDLEDREAIAGRFAYDTRMALALQGQENRSRGLLLGRSLICTSRDTFDNPQSRGFFDYEFNELIQDACGLKFMWRETSAVAPRLTIVDPAFRAAYGDIEPEDLDPINLERLLDQRFTQMAREQGAKLIVTEENRTGWNIMRHDRLMARLDDCEYQKIVTKEGGAVSYCYPMDYTHAPHRRDRDLFVKVLDRKILTPSGMLPRSMLNAIYLTMQQKGWNIIPNYDVKESGFTQEDINGAITTFTSELPLENAFKLVSPLV